MSNNMKKIKKAWIKNLDDVGMFATRVKVNYEVGSIVAASEPYYEVCMKMYDSNEETLERYIGLLLDEYKPKDGSISSIAGWLNRKHTKGHLLPRRVRIVEARVSRVMGITDEEWRMLGANETEASRIGVIGYDAWIWNTYLKLYKYETITNNAFENYGKEEN
jgi:hypothetical protein